jgi:initiation factor 1A
MVKNVSGGNKSKGFARKNFAKKDSALRVSEDEAEIYAQVTKMCGGSACQVVTLDGVPLLCHIRGKFRGRGKRDNFIGNGTWLLVGLREWEKEPSEGKLSNCDVIEVYNDADKIKLKNNINSINWLPFINYDIKTIGMVSSAEETEDTCGFTFADEKTQEYQELIEAEVAKTNMKQTSITLDDGEEIDVEDI